jgi:hypothetical protein
METGGFKSKSTCQEELTMTSRTGSTLVSESTRPLSNTLKPMTVRETNARRNTTGDSTMNLEMSTIQRGFHLMIKIRNSKIWPNKRSRWK